MNINALPQRLPTYLFALIVLLAAVVWGGSMHARQQVKPVFNGPEISVAEAQARINAGALVIDVRDVSKFDYRHIPAAISIPLAVLRTGIPASLAAAEQRAIVV